MKALRPVLVSAAIALPLTAGCATSFPETHDPGGPCLQVVSHSVGKHTHVALWRGDMMLASKWSSIKGALISEAADNPAAEAEVRSWIRTEDVLETAAYATLAWLAAVQLTGVVVLPATHEDRFSGPVAVGGLGITLLALGTVRVLDDLVAERHLTRALDIYNAHPPPGCGPPVPDLPAEGSE